MGDKTGQCMCSAVKFTLRNVKSPAFSYAGDTKKMTGAEVMAQFASPEGE